MIPTTYNWYDPEEKLPKLPKKRYEQRRVLIYWRWCNEINGRKPQVSFGRYIHDGKYWICEGATGNIEVLYWAYIKKPK